MSINIEELTDEDVVKALSIIGRKWIESKSLEVYSINYELNKNFGDIYKTLPAWLVGTPNVNEESAVFVRKMLAALNTSDDDEVREWVEEAFKEIDAPRAYVDPITLSIAGVILIGAILAARVRKIGPVEFYEGVPEEVAKVLKAGASIMGGQ